MNGQQRRQRHLRWRSWHLWSGVLSVVVVFNLAVTGVALNHTDDLSLASRHLNSDWLLRWYGFKPPGQVVSITYQGGQLLQLDEQLLINQQPVGEGFGDLLALCGIDQGLVITTSSNILLLTMQGELIEGVELPARLLGQFERVGCEPEGPIAEIAGQLYRPDQLFSNWQAVEQSSVRWSQIEQLGPVERTRVYGLYHQGSLSWERLLLDLHSGRLFGLPGVLLVDLSALLLVLQLISGVYLFLKRNG